MNNGSKHSIYGFDRFRLDVDKLMLYDRESAVHLPPKCVSTLAVFVENAGEIISKDDLIDAVWQDSIVEESNLSCLSFGVAENCLIPGKLSHIEKVRPYRESWYFN
jgi:DNA-binding winged helix-turn-helix (wHTH) protein